MKSVDQLMYMYQQLFGLFEWLKNGYIVKTRNSQNFCNRTLPPLQDFCTFIFVYLWNKTSLLLPL